MASWLDNYENVDERVAKFWADHPNGTVKTKIVTETDSFVIFRAVVACDDRTTYGFARRALNEDKGFEKCETAAIGRALANMGYAAKSSDSPPPRSATRAEAPAAQATSPGPSVRGVTTSDAAAIRQLLDKLEIEPTARKAYLEDLVDHELGKVEDLTLNEGRALVRQLSQELTEKRSSE
jgi:hypothetical protein